MISANTWDTLDNFCQGIRIVSPHLWRTFQSVWQLGPTPWDLFHPYPSCLSSKLSPGCQITCEHPMHLRKRHSFSPASASRPRSYLCPSRPLSCGVTRVREEDRRLLLAVGQSPPPPMESQRSWSRLLSGHFWVGTWLRNHPQDVAQQYVFQSTTKQFTSKSHLNVKKNKASQANADTSFHSLCSYPMGSTHRILNSSH